MRRSSFVVGILAMAMGVLFLISAVASFGPAPETVRSWLPAAMAVIGLGLAVAVVVLALRSDKRAAMALAARDFRTMEQGRLKRQVEALFDSLPDPVFLKDAGFRYIWVNDACVKAYGLSMNKIVGRVGADFMDPDTVPRSLASDRDAVENGSARYEMLFAGRWYEVNKRRVLDEKGHVEGVAGVLRDVTDRKLAQEKLEAQRAELERLFQERTRDLAESETRLRAVTDAAMDAIIMVDGNGKVRMWNKAAGTVFDYSPEEIMGRDVHEILAPEAYRETSREGVARFARTGSGPLMGQIVDLTALRKDGTTFHAELSLAPVEFHGERHAVGILRDVTERRAAEEELARYADDLRVMKDLQEENAAKLAETVVEVELARVELERKNKALSEAMALREDMERMARHDLKSPVQGITGAADVLKSYGNLSEEQLMLVSIIEESGYDMLEMIELSLNLYKMERGEYEPDRKPVDLKEEAERVALECNSAYKIRGVTVNLDVDGDGPRMVMAERVLIRSMLGNLVKNAVEASPDNAEVRVAISEANGRARIEVANQGVVPEAVQETFFDKYATHGKKDGSGLGTYSARLVAQVHGGDIAMQSAQTTGTRLIITLPFEE